jgi:Na+/H+ antiporter NhaD/arsenite permease-like protein
MHGDVLTFTVAGVVLSNVVSNVPAVLLVRPVMETLADPERQWLMLAMVTTFAGNLTLLGSVCNLIVAESARAHGVELSFNAYLRAGLPVTLVTLLWGVFWITRG